LKISKPHDRDRQMAEIRRKRYKRPRFWGNHYNFGAPINAWKRYRPQLYQVGVGDRHSMGIFIDSQLQIAHKRKPHIHQIGVRSLWWMSESQYRRVVEQYHTPL